MGTLRPPVLGTKGSAVTRVVSLAPGGGTGLCRTSGTCPVLVGEQVQPSSPLARVSQGTTTFMGCTRISWSQLLLRCCGLPPLAPVGKVAVKVSMGLAPCWGFCFGSLARSMWPCCCDSRRKLSPCRDTTGTSGPGLPCVPGTGAQTGQDLSSSTTDAGTDLQRGCCPAAGGCGCAAGNWQPSLPGAPVMPAGHGTTFISPCVLGRRCWKDPARQVPRGAVPRWWVWVCAWCAGGPGKQTAPRVGGSPALWTPGCSFHPPRDKTLQCHGPAATLGQNPRGRRCSLPTPGQAVAWGRPRGAGEAMAWL